MVTISAVRPPARFGSIRLEGTKVKAFREKSQLDESWINGGFFVLEPSFFDLIDGDDTVLERDPGFETYFLGEPALKGVFQNVKIYSIISQNLPKGVKIIDDNIGKFIYI